MRKICGVFLVILSVMLCLYSLLSLIGYLTKIFNDVPTSAYPIGIMIVKLVFYPLMGVMGIRAFIAGTEKLFTS